MKTLVADAESPEWWHAVMTRPWTFDIQAVDEGDSTEVGAGVEFRDGTVVTNMQGRLEFYKDKPQMIDNYPEPEFRIDWHQE
jgi:hypothetical protein